MSGKQIGTDAGGGASAKHGLGRKIIRWVLGGGAVTLALVVLQLMQAPQTVISFHEWICGWARGPAGLFGDCAAHDKKPTQALIIREAAPAASSDPLEVLTRRGYTPDHSSMYRAIQLGRKEDVELHMKAGVRMGALPIVHVPVSPEMWQFLVKIGAVEEPCDFDGAKLSGAESLLDGALRWQGNLAIYKSLCNGKYVQRIAAAAAKAKSDHARRVAEAEAGHAKRIAATKSAVGWCKSAFDAAVPDASLRHYADCVWTRQAGKDLPKAVREAACARTAPSEMALKSVATKLLEMGFAWPWPFSREGLEKCVEKRFCGLNATHDLTNGYFWDVMNKEPPNMEAWRRRRTKIIGDHCEKLAPERLAQKEMAYKAFYERFEKAMATR